MSDDTLVRRAVAVLGVGALAFSGCSSRPCEDGEPSVVVEVRFANSDVRSRTRSLRAVIRMNGVARSRVYSLDGGVANATESFGVYLDDPAPPQEGFELEVTVTAYAGRGGLGEQLGEASAVLINGRLNACNGVGVQIGDSDVRDGGPNPDAGPEADAGMPPCFDPTLIVSDPAVVSSPASAHREVRVVHGTTQFLMVWSSNDIVGGNGTGDFDILYQRSQDGVQWDGPFLLIPDFSTDDASDLWPDVASDGRGNWLVVWQRYLGGVDDRAEVYVSRSTDDGQSWSSAVRIADNREAYDAIPRVATDRHGTWVVVWHSHDVLGGDEGDIVYSRSVDVGRTWSAQDLVHINGVGDSGGDDFPSVAAGEEGEFMVVWDSFDELDQQLGNDLDVLWARSTDGAVTFSPPQPVQRTAMSDGNFDDQTPEVRSDGSGGFVVVMQARDGPGSIAAAQFPRGASTWTASQIIGQGTTTTYAPKFGLATDGRGDWMLLSHAERASPMNREVMLTWSVDGGRTWAEQASLGFITMANERAYVQPSLATDGVGTWVAAWHSADAPDRLRLATSACP